MDGYEVAGRWGGGTCTWVPKLLPKVIVGHHLAPYTLTLVLNNLHVPKFGTRMQMSSLSDVGRTILVAILNTR